MSYGYDQGRPSSDYKLQNESLQGSPGSYRQDYEKIHTYGSSKKVMLQYSTQELEELEKETDMARDELRSSHANLNRIRDDLNREKKLYEDLKNRSRTPSPSRSPVTPAKSDISDQRKREIQFENQDLINQRDKLEKEYIVSKSKRENMDRKESEYDSYVRRKERELTNMKNQNAQLNAKKAEEDHIRRMVGVYLDENQKLLSIVQNNKGRVSESELEYLKQNSRLLKEQIDQLLEERRKSAQIQSELYRSNDKLKSDIRNMQGQSSRSPSPSRQKAGDYESDKQTIEDLRKAVRELQDQLEQSKRARRDMESKGGVSEIRAIMNDNNLKRSQLQNKQRQQEDDMRKLMREIQELREDQAKPGFTSQKQGIDESIRRKGSEINNLQSQIDLTKSELKKISIEDEAAKNAMSGGRGSYQQSASPELIKMKDNEIMNLKNDNRRLEDDLRKANLTIGDLNRRQPTTSYQSGEVQRLQSDLNRITSERDNAQRDNERLSREIKMMKMDFDGNKEELERTQAKVRNMQATSSIDTTPKKATREEKFGSRTYMGQTSKEELELLEQRLHEFDECNKQLNSAINHLQTTMANKQSSRVYTGAGEAQSSTKGEASDLLMQLIRELDGRIKKMENLSSSQEVQFNSMIQDISFRQQGKSGLETSTSAPGTLDPAVLKLILGVKAGMDSDEIQTLKAIKGELESKLNNMATNTIDLENQVAKLISDINKSKKFFEQLTEDLNSMRDQEKKLRQELADSNRKLNMEADSKRQLEMQNSLTKQELERLLRDQDSQKNEMKEMRRKVEEYSARKSQSRVY